MKIKSIPSFVFLIFIMIPLQLINAQRERNQWYFGMLAGMRYNENTNSYNSLTNNSIERQIVLGQIEGPDNIICVSDEEGELLFYSDGRIFKNSQHENMVNSPTNEYAVWESQAAVARDPGNSNRFYVFVNIQDGLSSKLTYTIVDMTLDNGLGGLDPNNTHVVMTSHVGQHMVTARHANGKDIWLISIRRGTYVSYLITENGISSTPVTSNEGVSFFDGNLANFGVMEISPDNNLVAAGFPVLRKLFILEFDDLTGKLKLAYEEEDETEATEPFVAVEFSPNSKVLYTTYLNSGIQQYDISDLDNIPPRIDITTTSSIYPYLKRGPDGQIFSIESWTSYIGAIQNPDVIGLGCDYNNNVLSVGGTNLLDLPTFLLPKFPEGISYINICEGETTELNYSTSLRDATYLWDLGDGNTANGENISHTYASPGTYTTSVEVYDISNTLIYTDTKDITIYATPTIPNLDNIYLCSEDTNIFLVDYNSEILSGLDSQIFRVSYYLSELDALLQNNNVLEYIPEIGTQTIWVRVENALSPSCFDISNFDIITPEYITIDIPTEQFICDERSGLTLEAPDGFISYEWSTGENTQSITVTSIGFYTLTVVKDFGEFTCEAQTTVYVNLGDAEPIIEDINVLDWSLEHNSIEIILSEPGNYEYSIDGTNYQSSPVFLNLPLQDYTVYVRDANCLREVTSDTLYLLYYNKFFTPNGDGNNDYWQVINSKREENIEISIYNRYGKLIAKLNHYDIGWDGTFNGAPLPSSDYWFKVVRSNGKVHSGNFTLKR
ncbi:T9SS type B sorting domain-containing protein [Winogradskyella aurantia]|uniref:PKD domain-containing protein n=1 Tax=Winogradskyella aurantia TaxID=1915063 RepID=A0A265UUQ6_9FLAO|nr:T9SS type B sorting domain-containing protein [Winogradskyella aurantia]OZV69045.1 hypothetical protein CA834_06165 [Winogradskyella aurantia]